MTRPRSFAGRLWSAQDGRCYLRITEACRALDGALHELQLGKGSDHRGWTWEHVIPRVKAKKLLTRGATISASLKLLACEKCNQAKGAKLPEDTHIDLALKIYASLGLTNPSGDVAELVRRYRAWRNGEHTIAPPVPDSVEEALAQGGIIVRT